jgi:hypothetical protein
VIYIAPEDRFVRLVAHFADTDGVTHRTDAEGRSRRGFGSSALMAHAKIFAMLAGGRLVVKLPRARVDALVAADEGERFSPREDGRLMKEWFALDPGSDLDWTGLAEEALRFATS